MQIEAFRQFVYLAQEGSFCRAARACHMTQQGLNRAITSLETELGVKLLKRSRAGVALTPQGELLLLHARSILSEYDELVGGLAELEAEHGQSPGPVTLRATYFPVLLLHSLCYGQSSRGGVIISQEPFDSIIESACRANGDELYIVDVHQRSREKLRQNPRLAFEPLLATRCGVLHNRGRFPDGHILHRAELEDAPIATSSARELEKLLEWLFRDHPLRKIAHRPAFLTASFDFVRAAPENVALFSSDLFAIMGGAPGFDTAGFAFTPFATPEAIITVGALYNRDNPPSARHRREMGAIRSGIGRALSQQARG